MTEVVTGPLQVITGLVQDFQAGQRDRAGFLSGLDIVDQYLEEWSVGIDSLQAPPNYLEGLQLQEASQQGLDLFAQALGELREYAESPDEGRLELALVCAQDGHELLTELLQVSQANLARLEEDL